MAMAAQLSSGGDSGLAWAGLVSWIIACLAMVLAMVPYSLELIEPSADMQHHRRRLAAMNAISRATERCVPGALDRISPRRLWGAVYFASWAVLVAMGLAVSLFATTPGQSVAKNVAVVLGVTCGWFIVHAALIAFIRAIQRANRRDARSGAVPPEDEPDLPESMASAPVVATGPARSSLRGWFSMIVNVGVIIVVVFVLQLIVEALPIVRTTHVALANHARPVVITMAAVGFVLFMTSVLMLVLGPSNGSSRAMSHGEVEAAQARMMRTRLAPGATARAARYRIYGQTYGRSGHDEWSFGAMKAAWRSGAWRADPIWRRRYLATFGALLMTVGIFGIPAVFGPPWVMLLCGVALLYAFVRTTWAFWRC